MTEAWRTFPDAPEWSLFNDHKALLPRGLSLCLSGGILL